MLRLGDDDIHVGHEQERRELAGATQPRDEVAATRLLLEQDRFDPFGAQHSRDVRGAGRFVAGRIGGVDAEEVLQESGHLAADRVPIHTLHSMA